MEMTPTMEAAALLGYELKGKPHLSAAVDVLLAELERLEEIEERLKDEVSQYGGRDYAHDTYSQAKLDLAREILGIV